MDKILNDETIKTLEQTDLEKNIVKFENIDDLFKDLELNNG